MLSTETIIIILLVVLAVCIIALFLMPDKLKRMKKYTDVYIGMSESNMLEIIGGGYAKSSLKNNVTKYEWRINGSSHTTSRPANRPVNYGGVHIADTQYSGVKKLDIYVKDGLVEEIRPYNI